ncbi:hypothetical protein LMH81_00475 [Vibrio lentus]|uniref:hypothetical protein n=1 Tax=Vibrio lentus TaxID=136468 RepID=UPI001E42F00F|nr:hypothetical protein [Vibrio lentus]MCC4815007.1 hypothetical protein [Vibrio lentus]
MTILYILQLLLLLTSVFLSRTIHHNGLLLENIALENSTFDVGVPVKIDAQNYTNSKANWCELQPDLPMYSEGRTI